MTVTPDDAPVMLTGKDRFMAFKELHQFLSEYVANGNPNTQRYPLRPPSSAVYIIKCEGEGEPLLLVPEPHGAWNNMSGVIKRYYEKETLSQHEMKTIEVPSEEDANVIVKKEVLAITRHLPKEGGVRKAVRVEVNKSPSDMLHVHTRYHNNKDSEGQIIFQRKVTT